MTPRARVLAALRREPTDQVPFTLTDLTLREALDVWPDKVLWINFPSSLHLASLDTIRQTTRELIEAAAGTNRLLLGITEDVPPDRWQANFLAISETLRAAAGDREPQ